MLNKVDLVEKPALLALAKEANDRALTLRRPSWSRR